MYKYIYFFCSNEDYSMHLLNRLKTDEEIYKTINFYCIDGNKVPDYINIIPSLLVIEDTETYILTGNEIEEAFFGVQKQENKNQSTLSNNTELDNSNPVSPKLLIGQLTTAPKDPSSFAIPIQAVVKDANNGLETTLSNGKMTEQDMENILRERAQLFKD